MRNLRFLWSWLWINWLNLQTRNKHNSKLWANDTCIVDIWISISAPNETYETWGYCFTSTWSPASTLFLTQLTTQVTALCRPLQWHASWLPPGTPRPCAWPRGRNARRWGSTPNIRWGSHAQIEVPSGHNLAMADRHNANAGWTASLKASIYAKLSETSTCTICCSKKWLGIWILPKYPSPPSGNLEHYWSCPKEWMNRVVILVEIWAKTRQTL